MGIFVGEYGGKRPRIHESAYIAGGVVIVGDVTVGEDSSLWFHAIARGDQAPITIGSRTNIQDMCVLHISDGNPCEIGNCVTVGHRAVIHGARIGDNTMVGIGSIVLDGAEVGEYSIVAAGSVVTPGKKFPPRSFLLGTPARRIRDVTPEEMEWFSAVGGKYVERAKVYREISPVEKNG